jgi:hypothetical protein
MGDGRDFGANDLLDTAGSGSGDLDEVCGGPGDDYANIQDGDANDAFFSGPGTDNYSKDFADAVSNLGC